MPSTPKKPIRFRMRPDILQEIYSAVYLHRLTLEEFFEPAAQARLAQLAQQPPAVPAAPPAPRPGRKIRPRKQGT